MKPFIRDVLAVLTILFIVVFPMIMIVIVALSCNSQSPVFTPADNDPAYHCRDKNGHVLVDSTWCYPVDQTHTCCDIQGTCLQNDPTGCEYPPVDNNYPDTYVSAKRRIGKRMPDNSGVTP
jgi:hypothetical protein